jgi:protein-tyrosine phosphatase
MPKSTFLLFLPLLLFASCAKENPKVNAVCELMYNGSYLIKWETFPPMTGTVKIYESYCTDSFNLSCPIAEQSIETGYQRILAMPTYVRTYFKLVFNKDYSMITSDRIIPLREVSNFRDLGGYFNEENKQIRWGKLYRSGSLGMANKQDIDVLSKLGIKTIIDLQTERESYSFPNKLETPQVYNLPLRGNAHDSFFDDILSQRMKRSDILAYDQAVFSFILENNTDYFIKMFDILLEEKNYPIVIYCSLGKDRTALAAALILAALHTDENIIFDDYLLSNELIKYGALLRNPDIYPLDVQETITALFRAHRETLKYAIDLLKNQYGSIDNYLEKELKLTYGKRKKLKEIMLY